MSFGAIFKELKICPTRFWTSTIMNFDGNSKFKNSKIHSTLVNIVVFSPFSGPFERASHYLRIAGCTTSWLTSLHLHSLGVPDNFYRDRLLALSFFTIPTFLVATVEAINQCTISPCPNSKSP